ncbi:hypothetical protein D3C71_1458160 [compost metagenome]
MTIIRDWSASFFLLEMKALYSVSFVWATISSSALMSANRPALKFPSCVSDSRFHRNFSSHFSISWNSISPRLALFSSPSNRYARGSDSDPYSVIVEKSMLPVKSAISWDFGSDGLKVPMPMRSSSDSSTRTTRTFSISPA